MSMHAGHLSTSVQLQRVHAYLADGALRTTQEILDHTPVAAVSPAISALRKNGCVIECKYRATMPSGSRVFEYRMLRGQASLFDEEAQT